jgi:hypothetical protein
MNSIAKMMSKFSNNLTQVLGYEKYEDNQPEHSLNNKE